MVRDFTGHGVGHEFHTGLIVPHYDMHNRAFMLVPLLEIAPDATLPDGRPLRDLLARIDASAIRSWHG